ncbi:cupin domain-containing protein [Streptomyces sp. NPDC058678]|uniref:cupin domain-containing protein n=1 Tax=Streptomyces sp. NPDC058678 TaxID=3346595 RepID=UPI00364DB237
MPGDGSAPFRLGPGDVVFRPDGRGHGIADDPATCLTDGVQEPDGSWSIRGQLPQNTGPTTVVLCGAYRFSPGQARTRSTSARFIRVFPPARWSLPAGGVGPVRLRCRGGDAGGLWKEFSFLG